MTVAQVVDILIFTTGMTVLYLYICWKIVTRKKDEFEQKEIHL